MLYLDNRAGSSELYPYLRSRKLPVEMTRLEYGDVSFLGNGPDGPTPVGVELKKLDDVLKCITDGRFSSHQLPGLCRTYEHIWLVIIGDWFPMKNGELWVGKGRKRFPCRIGQRNFMYREFDHWMMTIQMRGGIHVHRVSDTSECAQWLHDLYSWWTAKEWSEHRSHLAFNNSRDTALLVKPSLVRLVAKELDGIGWEKSKAVEQRFRTVYEMVNADEKAWMEIDGVGKKLAREIPRALRTGVLWPR